MNTILLILIPIVFIGMMAFSFYCIYKKSPIILGKGLNSYHAINWGTWGDHIEFFDRNINSSKRTIWGHVRRYSISNGHILRSRHSNGKLQIWVISNVEWKNDPQDMFFADITLLGFSSDGYLVDKP